MLTGHTLFPPSVSLLAVLYFTRLSALLLYSLGQHSVACGPRVRGKQVLGVYPPAVGI